MATKKKKGDEGLEKIVEDLLKDVGDDRSVLESFLKEMIASYNPDQYVGIAEYVAKLADAMTKQNQVRAAAAKALLKKNEGASDDETDMDEIHKTVGLPFEDETVEDGSN